MSGKIIFFIIIAFIIFLVSLIVNGSILDMINKSSTSSKTDPYIVKAHKWAAGSVGISTAGLVVTLIIAIFLIYDHAQNQGDVTKQIIKTISTRE
jgi:ABC-type Fe3+ transport system permease subunit